MLHKPLLPLLIGLITLLAFTLAACDAGPPVRVPVDTTEALPEATAAANDAESSPLPPPVTMHAPTPSPQPLLPTPTLAPPPDAVQAAVELLALTLNAPTTQITVVAFQQVEWPDSCLGFPQAAEACARVVTPGWRVTLQADDGAIYEVHTDASGEQARLDAASFTLTANDASAEIVTADDLIAALQANGATAEITGDIQQPYFNVTGHLLEVNGAPAQLFEFADVVERQSVQALVSPGSLGFIDWGGTPHFWGQGRLIVLYVGEDEATVATLAAVLGDELPS